MEGGIGFLPNRCLDDIRRQVREIIDAQADPWLKQHYTLEFPKLHNEAFETPTDHPLVTTLSRACERQRGASEISGMIVSCDARLLHKVGGMPTVVFGPGLMKDAHSNHEQIDMKDIVKAAQILAVFLAELALEWKPITRTKPALPDAEAWRRIESKLAELKR